MRISLLPKLLMIVLLLVADAGFASAAEVKVFSTPTLKSAMDVLGPQFERATGHKLMLTYNSAAALKHRIEGGEPFDVAILLPPMVDDLARQGRVATGTRTDVARSVVGVAIHAGLPKPDVNTVDALRQTLLHAKSISYAADSASGAYLVGLLDRLGIAAEAKPQLKVVPGGRVIEAVASGEAELTVITVPNIVGVPGVELAGLLPAELQHYTVFSAAIAAQPKDAKAAEALVKFLMSPQATSVLETKGLERIAH